MPYDIRKTSGCSKSKPFGLFRRGTNKLLGCHETRKSAHEQIAAIERRKKKDKD